MLDSLVTILHDIFTLKMIFLMFAGVAIGTIGGALPGISASVTLALLLPVSFGLEPIEGLVFLGAIYTAAEYGGSISAILINTPGTAAAICTALDGYPMAKQGRVMDALNASLIGSSLGGITGTIALLLFTPTLASLSLYFGSPEMFWLALAGLAIVCNLAAESFVKGVIAVGIGMALALVGEDLQTGVLRYSFGNMDLEQGIALVPAILGLFAVSQMLISAGSTSVDAIPVGRSEGSFRRTLRFILVRPVLVLRSSIIGILVGVLPGAGASVASFIAYGEEKRVSKTPERFGNGAEEGVIAAETANNSMVGGSLVPLLAFGIPGSASAAVLFGGLTIHGMVPGPRLFSEHADLVYGFMAAFFPISLVMLVVGAYGARLFAKVVEIPSAFVVPTVMSLVIVGAYSYHSAMFDIYVALATGALGYFLTKFGFGIGPLCPSSEHLALMAA
jgi:putative tricarboxylic transport membrane protein